MCFSALKEKRNSSVAQDENEKKNIQPCRARSWALMVLGSPSNSRDSMILCLKVKFLPFYTPAEVGGSMGTYRVMSCPSKKQSVEWEHLMLSCSLAASSATWIALHKKRARHNDLQEMSVFEHCFMSWDPAFNYIFLFSLTACPRVSPSSSQRGEFTLTNCFHFQKATMPWKLKFTYKSCSSVQSVQLLIAEVASLLIFLEDLNSSKLPSVLPAAHSVQQHFPLYPELWSTFQTKVWH